MHIRAVNILSSSFPSRDCYPFELEIFDRTESLVFDKSVTLLIGENGTGKSTLLEAMAKQVFHPYLAG